MAIGATSVWECRTTGADTNGGFYTSGGTDYSQQDAAQLTATDLVCAGGTAVVTSAGAGFTSAMVGNGVYISDTGDSAHFTVGFYEIASYQSTTQVTLDRDPTDGTADAGGDFKVGGAIATIQVAADNAIAGNTVHIKGNRTIATAIDFDTNSGSNGSGIKFIGYGSSRDDGTKPVLTGSNVADIFKITVDYVYIKTLEFDGNKAASPGATECIEVSGSANNIKLEDLKVYDAEADCINFSGGGGYSFIYNCEVYGAVDDNIYMNSWNSACVGNYVHDGNKNIMLQVAANIVFNICHTSTSTNVDYTGGAGGLCIGNSIDGGNVGIYFGNSDREQFVVNNLITNANLGLVNGSAKDFVISDYNAFYSNNTDYQDVAVGTNDVALTADPYTDYAGHDFTLNNAAGGGAACRSAGFPGALPSGGTGYIDVGALQAKPGHSHVHVG